MAVYRHLNAILVHAVVAVFVTLRRCCRRRLRLSRRPIHQCRRHRRHRRLYICTFHSDSPALSTNFPAKARQKERKRKTAQKYNSVVVQNTAPHRQNAHTPIRTLRVRFVKEKGRKEGKKLWEKPQQTYECTHTHTLRMESTFFHRIYF